MSMVIASSAAEPDVLLAVLVGESVITVQEDGTRRVYREGEWEPIVAQTVLEVPSDGPAVLHGEMDEVACAALRAAVGREP